MTPFLALASDTISGTVGNFQSGGAFTGQRDLIIKSLLMSRCGQGHEPELTSLSYYFNFCSSFIREFFLIVCYILRVKFSRLVFEVVLTAKLF